VAIVAVISACSGAGDDEPAGGAAGGGGQPSKPGTPPVTSDFPDARAYVDAHNQVRAAVKEPAGYSGSWQPVPPVAWSDEVAATAQQWANHLKETKNCGLEHAMGSGYGENLAAGTSVDAERAVEMWASEIENYSYSPKYTFETNTGHYTQIVWRGTERIGCASAACSNRNVVVCRYDPPGNFIGAKIY
jgi:pathogenesis-related protein 1